MVILLILVGALVLLGFIIQFKTSDSVLKKRPFECGFEPQFTRRLRFSLPFFLLSLIFLIFDVELVLLFPFFTFYSRFSALEIVNFMFLVVLLSAGLV